MSQQINLFNPIFLKKKKYFSSVTMVQALGLILLGALLVAAYANFELNQLRKEAAVASTQLNATQAQLAKVTVDVGARQRTKPLEGEINNLEATVRYQRQVFDILERGELGDRKGYSEYFRAFSRQIVNGLWLTGFSISGAGNEIQMQGRALQPELVPAYIDRLKREPVMQGKSFATLVMQAPDAERADKGDQAAAGAKPNPATYIEFNLKSAGNVKERADSSGEKRK